jgi:hypothetical protein
MLRKMMFALATVAALGTVTIPGAEARGFGGGDFHGGGFHGGWGGWGPRRRPRNRCGLVGAGLYGAYAYPAYCYGYGCYPRRVASGLRTAGGFSNSAANDGLSGRPKRHRCIRFGPHSTLANARSAIGRFAI